MKAFKKNSPGISRRSFLETVGCSALAVPVWLSLAGCNTFHPNSHITGQEDSMNYFETAFGVTKGDLNRLMQTALSSGGDYCDLFFQHTEGNWIVMEDGKVNRAYTSVSLGVGVRVLKKERTGYAFSQVLDMPSMLEAARSAASLAANGSQPAGGRGMEVGNFRDMKGLDLYAMQRPWSEVGLSERMDMLSTVNNRLKNADPSMVKTLLQFQDAQSHILVATSDGITASDLRPRTGLFASCVAEKKGRRESGYYDASARAGLEFYTPELLDHLADKAAQNTLLLFEAKPLEAGEMPVVLAAGSAGILLHEAIGHGLEADFNRRRISTYADSLGQKVAGSQVTVVDDGTLPNAHGALNIDDEGNPSQRTVLVGKGVLRSYLHDRLSSRWYKCPSTGSGRRQSFEYAPMPRMRATFMESGEYEPEEIIKTVRKGLYADQFTNGQVNIGAGDFSFYVKSGYAIENGKLTHPVKDMNLIGNGPEVLSRITMVANDLTLAQGGFMCGKNGQTVPVSQGMPTALVSKVNVGSAGLG